MNIYKRLIHRLVSTFFGFAILFALRADVAVAGPPLICHTFDIGNAQSLPWTAPGWNLTGQETYDTSKLTSDTVKILASNSTVLVHMETLRRATLYARTNPAAAKELFNTLAAATKSASSAPPPALYYFDIGYLAESYKQWLGPDSNPARGIDGYALVKQALQLRGDDPQMEFAAALITLTGPPSAHDEHVQKAKSGAKNDSLLARNLAIHFMGKQGQTTAEVLAKPAASRESKP
jgi:hypothetical protein